MKYTGWVCGFLLVATLVGCASVSETADGSTNASAGWSGRSQDRVQNNPAAPDSTTQGGGESSVVADMATADSTVSPPEFKRDEEIPPAEAPDETGSEDIPVVLPDIGAGAFERTSGFLVTGYYPWWMRDSWERLDLGIYDRVMFFTLHAGSDGTVHPNAGWPAAQAKLLQFLNERKVHVVPTIAVLSADTVKTLFSEPESRIRFLDESLRVFRESGQIGLHLDVEVFEPVDESVRDGFLAYVDVLSSNMKALNPGAVLSLFTPAFDNAHMYDLERLGPMIDLFMVQGYDLHWMDGPTSGPLAPVRGWDGVNWITIADRISGFGIDPKKIIMTVPYYGYEWPVDGPEPGAGTRGKAREMTIERVDSTLVPQIHDSVARRLESSDKRRDPQSGSPYYALQTDEGWVQGWFEDEQSLLEKYRFIADRGLGGIAVFPIGYDNGMMDSAILRVFGERRY